MSVATTRVAVGAAIRSACLRASAGALAVLAAAPAAAHDFWIQPDRYRAQAPADIALTLQVGHGSERQRSAIGLRRIRRFDAVDGDGRRLDLLPHLRPQPQAPADARFAVPAGAWMLVLETDAAAQSRLPAARFNDYLHAEGLTPALEQRRAQGRMDADGSERYSRHSKALLRVGANPAATAAALARPLGLPLEILLDAQPQPGAASLPVRVLWQGRALAGALVKLTRLEDDAQPLDARRTDADGRARFAAPGAGTWLLNAVWTRPLPADAEVDFETAFSSLSFEIAAGATGP